MRHVYALSELVPGLPHQADINQLAALTNHHNTTLLWVCAPAANSSCFISIKLHVLVGDGRQLSSVGMSDHSNTLMGFNSARVP